jgi:hypothetical protein
MKGLKENQRFVIFDGPQQQGGLGTHYFSKDGTSTEFRSIAAKFFTAPDALDFAQRSNISIDALHSIGIEDFTDFDLMH